MYDVDQSFYTAASNTVFEHLNVLGTGAGNLVSTALVNGLLNNAEFKDKFISEFVYQLGEVWTPENVNSYIDTYRDMILPDMHKECDRWLKNYDAWERSVQSMRDFIAAREGYVLEHLKAQFLLSDEEMKNYGFSV